MGGLGEPDCSKFQPSADIQDYEWIRIMRIIIICISAVALLINIIVIISKKQYKFNTIRLFLFVQIFYAISLVSVTPHNPNFNLHLTERPEANDFGEYMECIIDQRISYANALEGFVNLTCYSVSYWFAVCITLYIRMVLQNNHKRFMKKQGPLIFTVITIIFLWYLIPFILTFCKGVLFSFGPTGFMFKGVDYLLYAGIVNRENTTLSKALVAIWMLVLPITLFVFHIRLLWKNHKNIRKLTQLDELNPRQYFLIRSGKLSFVIFTVQILNVGKLILGFFVDKDEQFLTWFVFILNIIFDLLALVLIWMYLKFYYKEGRNLQEDSEIMNRSLASSFATLTSSII